MVNWPGTARNIHRRFAWKLMTGVAIIALTAGCGRLGKKDGPRQRVAAVNYSKPARPPLKPNHPLYIATAHWAKQHQKNPRDPKAALNYARNLKALGSKEKALNVLDRTYQLNRGHGGLASEYGRLALDLGKVQVAEPLLNQAMRSKGQVDWRVLSALGTVSAKRGDHKKAQNYYLTALRKKPDATSVYNNLALSYALDGKVGDAEGLLKTAVAKGHNTDRIRQNLALVLGLQSKFSEAQKIAQTDLATNKIENNRNYLRSMVKPTRVAGSSGKTRNSKVKADTITTASLPARKAVTKTPRTTAKPPQKAITGKALKPKPAHAAKPVNVASALKTLTPKRGAQSPDKIPGAALPWRKKPAASTKIRTARLAARRPSRAVTRTPAKTNLDWSVTVRKGNAIKAKTPGTATLKSQILKQDRDFSFPAGN